MHGFDSHSSISEIANALSRCVLLCKQRNTIFTVSIVIAWGASAVVFVDEIDARGAVIARRGLALVNI